MAELSHGRSHHTPRHALPYHQAIHHPRPAASGGYRAARHVRRREQVRRITARLGLFSAAALLMVLATGAAVVAMNEAAAGAWLSVTTTALTVTGLAVGAVLVLMRHGDRDGS